jgi:hypothetical protein
MGTRTPLAYENDPNERAVREQRAARSIRLQRVERAGLEPCEQCGGTSEDVNDTSLACVCATKKAQLEARAARIAHEHRDPESWGNSDRIAP